MVRKCLESKKKILHDENQGHVPVVRPFGERVGEADILGTFRHQIVDDHQVAYARFDESVQIWRETFYESNVRNRGFQFVVSILVFAIKSKDMRSEGLSTMDSPSRIIRLTNWVLPLPVGPE